MCPSKTRTFFCSARARSETSAPMQTNASRTATRALRGKYLWGRFSTRSGVVLRPNQFEVTFKDYNDWNQMATRPKLAAITTVYRKYSHTQHIVDRFLEGYGWNGTHHHPAMDLASLYVDQVPAEDLRRDRGARFPRMKIYSTIAEALS